MKKKVLAFVLCLAMVLSVLPMSVFAAGNSNADDDFVIDENGVLTAYNGIGGDVVIPDGVTTIGFTVFAAKEITSVIIPDSVEMIDQGAFYNCQQLKSVTILGGAAIRGAAFYYCGNLTDLTISDRITDIDVQAFLCPALTNIHYPCDNDVSTIQTLMRPFGTYTYIPLDHQFTDNVCTLCGTEEFDIINGLLFGYNGNGGDVVIPDGVTSIRYEAFENCSSLTSVVIPNSVTSIGFSAFEGCTGLESITISDSAELGDYVFENCGNLENVYCPCSSDINAVKALMSPYGDYTYTRLDHQFTDNVCTLCGTEEFDIINGLLFGYNGNGGDVVIPDGVTSIRYEAFENCSSLTSVVIPNSVTSIGFSAFEGCTCLESITISDSAELGDYVFENCGNLENVYCPCSSDINAVKALMSPYGDFTYTQLDHQFENNVCTVCGIEEFVIEYGALVKYNGYGGDIVIPNGVAEISNLVFRGNQTITSITMPDVTKFEEMAFSDCGSLISVDMPKAKIIASSAFSGCYSLTTVNIPNVTIIQDDAFNGCISIKNIDVSKATRIYDKAFFDCFSLASVTMNSKVNLDGNVFKNCFDLQTVYCTCGSDVNELKGKMQSYGAFKYVKSAHEFKNNVCESCGMEEFVIVDGVLTQYNGSGGDIVIPAEVTEIAGSVFSDNQTITSVNMPNVTKIGDNAFEKCYYLKNIVIPKVETIGWEAFRDCITLTDVDLSHVKEIDCFAFQSSALTSIDISNVEFIGSKAFSNCLKLETVTADSRSTDFSSDAFENCTNLKTVYVTCGSDLDLIKDMIPAPAYIQLEHAYVDGVCSNCGKVCEHVWESGVCTVCGDEHENHTFVNVVCSVCGKTKDDCVFGDGWYIDEEKCLHFIGAINNEAGPTIFDTDTPWKEYADDILTVVAEPGSSINNCLYLFNDCINLKSVDLSHLDTSAVIDMRRMFMNCASLKEINLNGIDTQKVTDMSAMFFNCLELTSIDFGSIHTENVTDMSGMFAGCRRLASLNLNAFDTKNVESMAHMFSTTGLKTLDLTGFDTAKVKDMSELFYECGELTSVDLSSFDTAQVTDMRAMFCKAKKLTAITFSDKFSTANVENMASMFNGCEALKTLDLSFFDTAKVELFHYMFRNCTALETLDISTFIVQDPDSTAYMLDNLNSIQSITIDGSLIDNLADQLMELSSVWYTGESGQTYRDANELKNIMGKVTLVTKLPDFKFNSCSLVLSGELVMDINCTVNDMEAVKDGYMEMTVGSTSTQKVCLADAAHNADGTYSFLCYLNVLQMADDITLSFHYGDTVIGPYTKSVAQYLNNIKTKYSDNAELVALVEAIADYGHFAQPALQEANGFEDGKYQTMNRISNAAFTLPDAADLASYKATKTGSVAQITNVSRALALDHGTDILLYFNCADGYTPDIAVTDKDGNAVACPLTKDENGRYILTIPNISAHKLGDFYTVSFDNGEMTIDICALSYAYSILNSSASSTNQKNAVAALYAYYQAAIAYQAAHE